MGQITIHCLHLQEDSSCALCRTEEEELEYWREKMVDLDSEAE